MLRLSIIIPVYNVEKYIDECLESITGQTDENVEIILVDDGSTDSSGELCDAWAQRIDSIRVIHKENGGLASSRNCGLEAASGEYLLFVDSDDRIAQGSLKIIMRRIDETHADLYFLTGYKFFPDGSEERLDDEIKREKVNNKDSIELVRYISGLTRYPGSACTKAYKRSFLQEKEIRFPSDGRIAEDLGFTLKCLIEAETFDVVEERFYEYRQNREGSITSNSTKIEKSFWNLSVFIDESIALLTSDNTPKDEKAKCALGPVAYEYSVALLLYGRITENRDDAKRYLTERAWLCKYMTSRRGKSIRMSIRLLGIDSTASLLVFFYDRRGKGVKKK